MAHLPKIYYTWFHHQDDSVAAAAARRRQCDAERVFGNKIVRLATQVQEESLGGPGGLYLGIKLRRGDDLRNTQNCTDAKLVADSAIKVVQRRLPFVSSNNNTKSKLPNQQETIIYLFVMMEPEPKYKETLLTALHQSFSNSNLSLHYGLQVVFENEVTLLHDLATRIDNYVAYCVAYAVSESASLGRIEARRLERWDKRWTPGNTCSLSYSQSHVGNNKLQWRFFESGWYSSYHQLYPPPTT